MPSTTKVTNLDVIARSGNVSSIGCAAGVGVAFVSQMLNNGGLAPKFPTLVTLALSANAPVVEVNIDSPRIPTKALTNVGYMVPSSVLSIVTSSDAN